MLLTTFSCSKKDGNKPPAKPGLAFTDGHGNIYNKKVEVRHSMVYEKVEVLTNIGLPVFFVSFIVVYFIIGIIIYAGHH